MPNRHDLTKFGRHCKRRFCEPAAMSSISATLPKREGNDGSGSTRTRGISEISEFFRENSFRCRYPKRSQNWNSKSKTDADVQRNPERVSTAVRHHSHDVLDSALRGILAALRWYFGPHHATDAVVLVAYPMSFEPASQATVIAACSSRLRAAG